MPKEDSLEGCENVDRFVKNPGELQIHLLPSESPEQALWPAEQGKKNEKNRTYASGQNEPFCRREVESCR